MWMSQQLVEFMAGLPFHMLLLSAERYSHCSKCWIAWILHFAIGVQVSDSKIKHCISSGWLIHHLPEPKYFIQGVHTNYIKVTEYHHHPTIRVPCRKHVSINLLATWSSKVTLKGEAGGIETPRIITLNLLYFATGRHLVILSLCISFLDCWFTTSAVPHPPTNFLSPPVTYLTCSSVICMYKTT